ncbi:MAG: hypothetical protein ACXVP0_16295 [Bacteroidia bacterium]
MAKANFDISSNLPISKLFLERQITTFTEACSFIKHLPYGRNENKNDLAAVFTEKRGTCSTKHALLRQLAIENNADHVRLKLGVFKMSKANTPEVGGTLDRYGLTYIPEAHNYLSVNGEIVDCTKRNSSKDDFAADLISETEIGPEQITDFKVRYHKTILKDWLLKNPDISISFDELWTIREQCIADLSRF